MTVVLPKMDEETKKAITVKPAQGTVFIKLVLTVKSFSNAAWIL
jgi:hypothetical protein